MTASQTHYQIEIPKAQVTLKLSYRAGKFYRLERSKGNLPDTYLKAIGRIIPPYEKDVEAFKKAFTDVQYTAIVKEKSQFSAFNDAWHLFYEGFYGYAPKFGATEGMHLKKIITHLNKIGGSETEALVLWKQILAAWPKLNDFHKDNTDIKYINSRLNVILNAVKKAITGTSTTGGSDNSTSL